MLTLILIILIVLVAYYAYYSKQISSNDSNNSSGSSLELSQLNAFMKSDLNSSSLSELKTKLAGKTLNELIEERQSLVETLSKVEEQNQDWETEVDTLTRSKNSLEQDLLAQSNAFQARLKEKDREVKKLKEDLADEKKRLQKAQTNLTSEKQQHKGSLERIKLLTEQITNLTKENQNLTDLKTSQGNIIKEQNKKIRELQVKKE